MWNLMNSFQLKSLTVPEILIALLAITKETGDEGLTSRIFLNLQLQSHPQFSMDASRTEKKAHLILHILIMVLCTYQDLFLSFCAWIWMNNFASESISVPTNKNPMEDGPQSLIKFNLTLCIYQQSDIVASSAQVTSNILKLFVELEHMNLAGVLELEISKMQWIMELLTLSPNDESQTKSTYTTQTCFNTPEDLTHGVSP